MTKKSLMRQHLSPNWRRHGRWPVGQSPIFSLHSTRRRRSAQATSTSSEQAGGGLIQASSRPSPCSPSGTGTKPRWHSKRLALARVGDAGTHCTTRQSAASARPARSNAAAAARNACTLCTRARSASCAHRAPTERSASPSAGGKASDPIGQVNAGTESSED
ncbi:hypothetical protein T492DRAFT_32176 [Pavlovales sp. CCMP2436]|nr:hypothetical protein T492DRAFT_32176 [Pavlovales sp. CCMP2436]